MSRNTRTAELLDEIDALLATHRGRGRFGRERLSEPGAVSVVTTGGIFGGRIPGRVPSRTSRLSPLSDIGEQVAVVSGGGIFGLDTRGRFIEGLAAPWNKITDGPQYTASGDPKRWRFAPYAFTDSITDARLGRRPIYLLREHDDDRLIGSTDDGGFMRLDQTAEGLRVVIDTRTARGQAVAALLNRNPAWNLSIGFGALDKEIRPMADGGVLHHVTRARLDEISIVRNGAFSRTYLAHPRTSTRSK